MPIRGLAARAALPSRNILQQRDSRLRLIDAPLGASAAFF